MIRRMYNNIIRHANKTSKIERKSITPSNFDLYWQVNVN